MSLPTWPLKQPNLNFSQAGDYSSKEAFPKKHESLTSLFHILPRHILMCIFGGWYRFLWLEETDVVVFGKVWLDVKKTTQPDVS